MSRMVLGFLLAALVAATGCTGGVAADGDFDDFEPEPTIEDPGDVSWLAVSGASLHGVLGTMNASGGSVDDAVARYEGGLWFYLEHQDDGLFGRAIIEVPYDWTQEQGVLISTLGLGDDPTRAALWGIDADETDVVTSAGSDRPYTCSGAEGGLCENRRNAEDFIVRVSPNPSVDEDARHVEFVFWAEDGTAQHEVSGQLSLQPR